MAKKPSEVSDALASGEVVDAAELPPAPEPVPDAAPAPNYTDGPLTKPDGTVVKVHRILVWQEGESMPDLEYLHDYPKDREVTIGGKPFDHCNTTADGTWVYRYDRKN